MNTAPLEELQTPEGAQVLNTIAQVRKCGLEGVLSLPQIVVCGDQSSGKSSVLEALTQIPFPRNDNLCTRFATEISLRCDPIESLKIRVIPAATRTTEERSRIKNYWETITNFQELPKIMQNASKIMGILDSGKSFAKDVLLYADSGSEAKFLDLARNEDGFFKLGWHVIKNRTFEERDYTFEQRSVSEKEFFTSSNFKTLPGDDCGIDTLRAKLCRLLCDHIKKDLPHLQNELETALQKARDDLGKLGESTFTIMECREYLTKLNMACYELVKAGVGGNYAQEWFQVATDNNYLEGYSIPQKRIRALVQLGIGDIVFHSRDEQHWSEASPEVGRKYYTCQVQMGLATQRLRCAEVGARQP